MKSLTNWQTEIKAFNDARQWSNPKFMKDLLLNVVEEVGEARNIIKWVPEEQSPVLIEKNKEEWADFIGQLQYLVLKMAYLASVDSEEALKKTMIEFESRFPVDKVKGNHSNILAGGHDGKYAKVK